MRNINTIAAAALLSLGALAAASSPANAQVYVSGSLGLLMPQDIDASGTGFAGSAELDNGVGLNVAVGYRFPFNVRVEGEFGYYNSSLNKITVTGVGSTPVSGGDIDLLAGTANAFYDFKTGTMFTPYLGGGIGFVHEKISDSTVTGVAIAGGSSTEFLWQLEGGVSIDVTPHMAIVPSYRYLHINDGGTFGGVTVDDTSAHLFKIGLRYTF